MGTVIQHTSTWEDDRSGFILTIKLFYSLKKLNATPYAPRCSLQLLCFLLTNTEEKKAWFLLVSFPGAVPLWLGKCLSQHKVGDESKIEVGTYFFSKAASQWPYKVFICTTMSQGDFLRASDSLPDASIHWNLTDSFLTEA